MTGDERPPVPVLDGQLALFDLPVPTQPSTRTSTRGEQAATATTADPPVPPAPAPTHPAGAGGTTKDTL